MCMFVCIRVLKSCSGLMFFESLSGLVDINGDEFRSVFGSISWPTVLFFLGLECDEVYIGIERRKIIVQF